MSARTAQPGHQKQASLLELGVISLFLVFAIFYLATALTSEDFLWILPHDFEEQPAQIELYHEGQVVTLQLGDPDYTTLTRQLNAHMDHINAHYEASFRPSDLPAYLEDNTVAVFVFPKPVGIRSQWRTGDATHLLVPVRGARAGKNLVFPGTGEKYGHGGLVLDDLSPLYESVQQIVAARIGTP